MYKNNNNDKKKTPLQLCGSSRAGSDSEKPTSAWQLTPKLADFDPFTWNMGYIHVYIHSC